MTQLSDIQHSTLVFALAFSPDGHLMALGGEAAPEAVTVWDTRSGELVAACGGLPDKVQSLAFSSDSSRLGAVNEYGGLGVWSMPDGALVEQKANAKTRRGYRVFFIDNAGNPNSPIIVSASSRKGRGRVAAISPSGKFTAVAQYAFIFTQPYYSTKLIASCDLRSYSLDFVQHPTRLVCWTSNSGALGLQGEGWCAIWNPDRDMLASVPLSAADPVYAIALVPGQRAIGMATGKRAISIVEVPDSPMETIWHQRVQRVLAAAAQNNTQVLTDSWTWNERSYAYEGVDFEGMNLVWYEHQQNTLAGSSAHVQSIDDFLAKGADLDVPEDIRDQVIIAAAKKQRAGS